MARVHYHEFYCFDSVPLELEDDEGTRITVNCFWPQTEDTFSQRLEEEIKMDLNFLRAWKSHASDWWIVIVYWNNRRFGTHRGVGKKPRVKN